MTDPLARGVMACPECTVQREARLQAELRFEAMKLALARSLMRVLKDGPESFERITGQSLKDYVAERRAKRPA